MFKLEKDVRQWLRAIAPGRVFWIEAAAGGSVGMPDCHAYDELGRGFWLECKLGTLNGDRLSYRLRAAQRACLIRIIRAGGVAGLLIGIKGTRKVCVAPYFEHSPIGCLNTTGDLQMIDTEYRKNSVQTHYLTLFYETLLIRPPKSDKRMLKMRRTREINDLTENCDPIRN